MSLLREERDYYSKIALAGPSEASLKFKVGEVELPEGAGVKNF
jgi:hypothetical protein